MISTNELSTITVRVEQKHIDNGKRNSCKNCMVSLAVNDCLVEGFFCYTGLSAGEVFKGRSIDNETFVCTFRLFSDVDENIVAFDNGVVVHPFEFPLTLPTYLLKPSLHQS